MKIEKPTRSDLKKVEDAKEAARNREAKIAKVLNEALRNKRAKE